MLVFKVAAKHQETQEHCAQDEWERHSAAGLRDACSLFSIYHVARLAVKCNRDASVFRLIELETLWAYKTFIDTYIVFFFVFLWAVLDAFSAQVKTVVFYASLASACSATALKARLLTCLTDAIDRGLVLSTACLLTCLVEVQKVPRFTSCTRVCGSSTLGAIICAKLTLLSQFVEDLNFGLAQILAGISRWIQFHVLFTAGAGLRRSLACLTLRVALLTLAINKDTDVFKAFVNAALMEEKLVVSEGVTRYARRRQAFTSQAIALAFLASVG